MRVVRTLAGHLLHFDDELLDFVYDTTGYCVSTNNAGDLFVTCTKGEYTKKVLARVLMNCPADKFVDHINGNPLDNRLKNLRLVTSQQNACNSKSHKDKKDNLPKGVFRCKDKFRVKICHNYEHIHVGIFNTVEEAVEAYEAAAEKYFGVFATHLSRKVL